MSELDEAKLRHPSTGALQEVIATNAVRAFNTGVKHESERTAKAIEQFGIQESARLNSEPMGEAHWAYLEGIKAALNLIKGEQKSQSE
jgi:hypothetical protein